MRSLDALVNYFVGRKKRDPVFLESVDLSEDGLSAVVTYSNGNSYRVRTEMTLKRAGI